MNGFNSIAPLAARWLRLGAIVMLMLLTLAVTAEAQRGKKSGRDKGKSSKVQSTKKKAKQSSGKRATQSRSSQRERTARGRSSGRERTANRERSSSSERASRETRRAPATRATVPKPNDPPAATNVESGPADLAQQTLLGTGGSRPVRTKRSSPAIPPLAGDQLQAITASRQEIEPTNLRGYPEIERSQQVAQPFYAEGSIGIYTTAALRVGYYGSSFPYDYSLYGSAGSTNGFVDNGTKLSYAIGGRAGYVIGDGYGIFSGGHMGGDFEYGHDKYRRYALPAAPERKRTGWMVGANGQNSYNGTTFELNGGYRQLSLSDSGETREGSLDGSVKIRTQWNRLTVGGEADLRLTNLAGGSISYGRLEAYAKYSTGIIALRAGGSFGVGGNSDGSTETRLAPLAEINFHPFYGVMLSAGITGGVRQNTLRGLLDLNPYVVSSPLIYHEGEKIGYRGSFRFEPWQSSGVRLSAARSSYENYAYFIPTGSALFAPLYGDAMVTRVTGDFYLEMGKSDMLAVQATFMETSLNSTGRAVPFVPKWDAELMYMKRLAGIPLSITGTARYIGSRDNGIGGTMDPVTLLGLKGRYAITSHFDVTLELNNLINQKYEIWPGYQERGFFGAIGVAIKY